MKAVIAVGLIVAAVVLLVLWLHSRKTGSGGKQITLTVAGVNTGDKTLTLAPMDLEPDIPRTGSEWMVMDVYAPPWASDTMRASCSSISVLAYFHLLLWDTGQAANRACAFQAVSEKSPRNW